jgi:hypothetical protein
LWRERSTAVGLITVQAGATLVTSVLAAIACAWNVNDRFDTMPSSATATGAPFLHYGLPRSISPFVEMLFFLLGPWLLRHDLVVAGYLLLGLTLLRTAQMFLQPVSLVGGVTAARLSATGDSVNLRSGMSMLLGTVCLMASLGVAIMYPWAEVLLRLWLGTGAISTAVYPYAKILLLGSLPYAIFLGLKEIVEMVWPRPRNMVTMLGSCAVLGIAFVLLRQVVTPGHAVAGAYVISMCCAAAVTIWWSRSYLRPPSYYGFVRIGMFASAILCVNTVVARSVSGWPLLNAIAVFLGMSAISAGVYLWLLLVVRPSGLARDVVAFIRPSSVPVAAEMV